MDNMQFVSFLLALTLQKQLTFTLSLMSIRSEFGSSCLGERERERELWETATTSPKLSVIINTFL